MRNTTVMQAAYLGTIDPHNNNAHYYLFIFFVTVVCVYIETLANYSLHCLEQLLNLDAQLN